jgi:hypothetical protein
VDGATSLAGAPGFGINHVAVSVKDAAGKFYNSMSGLEGGNIGLVSGTCHQIANQAILQAGYALTVSGGSSGWFSYLTAAVYGPYGFEELDEFLFQHFKSVPVSPPYPGDAITILTSCLFYDIRTYA